MSDLALYVICRTDLNSLTPGKMAAQATHAANAMVYAIENAEIPSAAIDQLAIWQAETPQGFGTAIVLDGGDMENIREAVTDLLNAGFMAGIVVDPDYPLRDGRVTHYLNLETCGWAFGNRDELKPYLQFSLLK